MKRDEVAQIEQRVRQFIHENFYVSDAMELAEGASLIATGVIDSTGVLELMAFLEGEFGIAIAEAEVIPANLETIDRIARFVHHKQAGPAPLKVA
jgi:acyl carrier protein